MTSKKILFVINPIAGGVNKDAFVNRIEAFATQNKINTKEFITTGEDDEEQIKKIIGEFNPQIVAAVGGDGTLLLVAKCILKTDITLGIIPFGSANGMAAELLIPNDKNQALDLMLQDNDILIDTLLVDNKYPCLHIGDIGFNAKIVKRFEEDNQRGLLGYAKHFIREFRLTQSMKSTVITDNNSQKVRCHMIAFANARKYGTGALLNPIGKLNDGFFELCIIKKISFKVFLLTTFTLFSGALYKTKFAKIIRCSKAQIKLKKYKKMTVQIDGEIIGERNKITIEIVPRSLKVKVPLTYQKDISNQLITDIAYEEG